MGQNKNARLYFVFNFETGEYEYDGYLSETMHKNLILEKREKLIKLARDIETNNEKILKKQKEKESKLQEILTIHPDYKEYLFWVMESKMYFLEEFYKYKKMETRPLDKSVQSIGRKFCMEYCLLETKEVPNVADENTFLSEDESDFPYIEYTNGYIEDFVKRGLEEYRNFKKENLREFYKDKRDKFVICKSEDICSKLNSYFDAGYTLSQRPYLLENKNLLFTFTKKFIPDVEKTYISLDKNDIQSAFALGYIRTDSDTFNLPNLFFY